MLELRGFACRFSSQILREDHLLEILPDAFRGFLAKPQAVPLQWEHATTEPIIAHVSDFFACDHGLGFSVLLNETWASLAICRRINTGYGCSIKFGPYAQIESQINGYPHVLRRVTRLDGLEHIAVVKGPGFRTAVWTHGSDLSFACSRIREQDYLWKQGREASNRTKSNNASMHHKPPARPCPVAPRAADYANVMGLPSPYLHRLQQIYPPQEPVDHRKL